MGAWSRILSSFFTDEQPATPTVQQDWTENEWNDTQFRVATEQGLLAVVDLARFQREAWNDLVDGLEDMGLSVNFSKEAYAEYDAIMERFHASFRVAREAVGITEEQLQEMMRLHKEWL